MRHDLIIAGFGGQGVLLAGNLLSIAAMEEGNNVCYFPAYGVEKRGGAATCTVVISDGAPGSPVVGSPSFLIALNQSSLERFGSRVRPGGICMVNSTLVDTSGLNRDDIELIEIPMNDIASGLGDFRMVNMVALGAYAEMTGAVALTSLGSALKEALPERNHRFIPANMEAIEAGASVSRDKKVA